MKNNNINKLLAVMKKLRDPKKGCPWDKKQTMESIIPYSIEEVYEVAEQIYNKDYIKLKEELGDLLFQVIYLSQIASEENKFNFNEVVKEILGIGNTLCGHILIIDALKLTFRKVKLNKRSDCYCNEKKR